jgi:hypothetical protein
MPPDPLGTAVIISSPIARWSPGRRGAPDRGRRGRTYPAPARTLCATPYWPHQLRGSGTGPRAGGSPPTRSTRRAREACCRRHTRAHPRRPERRAEQRIPVPRPQLGGQLALAPRVTLLLQLAVETGHPLGAPERHRRGSEREHAGDERDDDRGGHRCAPTLLRPQPADGAGSQEIGLSPGAPGPSAAARTSGRTRRRSAKLRDRSASTALKSLNDRPLDERKRRGEGTSTDAV